MDIKDKTEELFSESDIRSKYDIIWDFIEYVADTYKLDISYRVARKYLQVKYDEGC